MAWIRTVAPGEARGLLATLYDRAVKRAGRVFHVVSLMSPNPRMIVTSIEGMYAELMTGASPLSRAQREMIAVVVSAANGCHY